MSGEKKRITYRYAPSSPRGLCSVIFILLLLAGITALVLYLVYRSSKPHISVVGAAVYDLSNATNPANVISTSMQFTVVIRNPNERASIYFDRLSAYVTYKNQAITAPAAMPPLFVDRDTTVAVSPILGGGFVPVSGDVASGLVADEVFGVVSLRIIILGRVKYKSGPFRSGWNGIYVRCDMLLGIKKGILGQVPLLGEPECAVDI